MEVTEKQQGAKGSDATTTTTTTTPPPPPPPTAGAFGQKYFEVDHPFIFLVWDYYSGMLLLMGRVVHPEVVV
jgi:serine protease inhibitor